MLSKKTGALIFLLSAAGVLTSFALPKLSGEEGAAPPEPTTGFNVTNESEIFFGKPAFIYKFNTGETLELKVLKGKVDKGDAMASFLLPVIMDVKGKKLKMNESIYLKNGYAVMLKHIDNRSLYLRISRNNITVREAWLKQNSSLEYLVEINEDKKQKSIRIMPGRIGRDEAVLDITQYGDKIKIKV